MHSGSAPSAATHSRVESSGELWTISADTVPGPSLTNEMERGLPAGSVDESRSSCLSVIVAAADVLDGSGSSDGVAVGWAFDDAAT
jgi:hypothetical protein